MDAQWLAQEAHKLHSIFQGAFFTMLTAFLLLAVVMEFFKMPLGESPAFTTLMGRSLIATLLLVALPEIMNIVADTTDPISKEIGDLYNFKLVLSRVGDKLKSLSISWTSFKDLITILISFLSFIALYITVYFADAAFLYCWTLIYVFSPLVLALFIFPQTAGATTAMFRAMLEVSLWKICWSVMATLLWSTALSDLNSPETNINWLTSIVLNLMLMISVLMTPKVVRALLSGGLSELSSGLQGAAMQAASLTPAVALAKTKAGLLFAPKKAMGFARKQAGNAASHSWKGVKEKARSLPQKVSSRPQTQPRKNDESLRNYNPIQPDRGWWRRK